MKPAYIKSVVIIIVISIIALLIYSHVTGTRWVIGSSVYIFENVKGPETVTPILEEMATAWEMYSKGSTSRLAIYLTDENSAWLGLVHGLKTIGVPFLLTTDIDRAVRHKVMIAYPAISGRLLDQGSLKKLAAYARSGGILIGVNVLGGGLTRLFGFGEVKASRQHTYIKLADGDIIESLNGLPGNRIRLANADIAESTIGTNHYTEPKHSPIGTYEDGSAAIIYNTFKNGNIYAFGFDIGFYILKGYNRRLAGVANTYVNGFEPSIDIVLSLLKNIYRSGQDNAVTIGTAPGDHSLSVIFTHDIDYGKSMANAVSYAMLEEQEKTGGTHFIQTKYIRDWNDKIFFNDTNLSYLREIAATGAEIASHSVSHSRVFAEFPAGDGSEYYPDYRPFVVDGGYTYKGTLLGELRVSRFLLDHFTPDQEIISFRPGYLANPTVLPQALQATGYRFSSSVTANISMTHLPFRLNYDRDINAETSIFEFPITIEDELPPRMGDRLPEAIEIAEKISRYGGIYVVLIHPDILGHKFSFQQGLTEAVREYAWFGSISGFGNWWLARDRVELDVTSENGRLIVTVDAPEPVQNLALEIPADRFFASSNSRHTVEQHGTKVVLEKAEGKIQLVLVKGSGRAGTDTHQSAR